LILDPKIRLELVSEIRENIELVHHATEYQSFLLYLFPVIFNILREGQPQFVDGPEQKTRNILLEILNRLPNNDLLRPNVSPLMRLAMFLLEVENEENAIICLRIIIDLHKNYRPSLDAEVQPFLDIVQKFYTELPNTVQHFFGENASSSQAQTQPQPPPQAQTQPTTSTSTSTTEPQRTVLIRSTQSFKVLAECPIIVVLLFQLYTRFLSINIPKFLPLIVQTLGLKIPRPVRELSSQQRNHFVDFITAQVKV
jgi:transformation/transcription domain-associated protein